MTRSSRRAVACAITAVVAAFTAPTTVTAARAAVPAGSATATSVDAPAGGGSPAERPPARAGERDARTVLSSMSLPQRVGQLFMVGTPATQASSATLAHIADRHVGNVMLTGRSHGGTRTPARVAAAMQSRASEAATKRVRLFISTDQEGGLVQGLNGTGISDIPFALLQGRWGISRLRQEASRWARQLREAGVNMNLAPVLDTVPSPEAAQDNPPIGAYDRQFGYTTRVVAGHGRAFMAAMNAGGVAPSIKHFPGLGRVHGNTDTATGVTDRVTRRRDPYLAPFQASIDAGAPFVMMSTAYYSRLDPKNPAAFSSFVIKTMLRGDLGFRGIVISDDLANARQVSRWGYGQRAVKFLRAGGDMVLIVNPAALPAMFEAVLARARDSETFRAKVNRSALRVLHAKEARGLLAH